MGPWTSEMQTGEIAERLLGALARKGAARRPARGALARIRFCARRAICLPISKSLFAQRGLMGHFDGGSEC